ncbi:MAG: cyclodeaminase/cyclohydrolase family protein [Candidatus Omnitrophota bacterium]|nr:cyclodeaminase/cyclohydrolase family protein [Candidatus Omnitrophota bacterium]
MHYRFKGLNIYLDDLAAKIPAPGGGSAAAMSAAMGAALMSMVANFTIGKPKYAAFDTELKKILEKSEKLRADFLNLVDLDVAAYQSGNIRDALDVPFMLSRLCYEAIKLCPPLLKKGNANLISDVGVAVIFLEAAFSSAVLNVQINLKALGDEKLRRAIGKELTQRQARIKKIRLETEAKVGEIIRE